MPRSHLIALAVGSALSSLIPHSAVAQVAPNTLPGNGQVAAGSATFTSPSATTLQINQSSDRAIINWQSFSIGSAARVNFIQPGASSVVLNRVLGSNPSDIYGRMTANGQVFLSNPNGVLFAPGASVEVGALMATTLSISDQDFLAGRYRFSREGNAGAVVNQGSIRTPGGYTALAGPQVRNDGIIVAHAGTVALAAGDRVALDMIGDGLINVSVEQAALNAAVINTGTIEANGGRVLLTARSANALLDTVVNSTGVLRANSLAAREGEIVLEATGTISVEGVLEASRVTVNAPGININCGQCGGAGEVIPDVPVLRVDPRTISTNSRVDPRSISTNSVITSTGAIAVSSIADVFQSRGLETPSAGNVISKGRSVVLTGGAAITTIGLLPPMSHTIVGAGVSVPTDALLLPR
jgi:filamentous hemagglutinin family protein